MKDSAHFLAMVTERGIDLEWADRVIEDPEIVEDHDDGTRHFARRIPEMDERWLRIVVNARADPWVRVTAFFDRRLRRRHEDQGR